MYKDKREERNGFAESARAVSMTAQQKKNGLSE